MTDVYARITEVDSAVLERLASAQEVRAASTQHAAMRESYWSDIPFVDAARSPEARVLEARVLEVGCGTGAVTRALAAWPGVAEVVGADPSPAFLAKARNAASGLANVSFEEADGRSLPFPDADFDVVVFHTSLCHIPGPEAALKEAHRVLRPNGTLAVFDGDYATTTLAIAEDDPLQACADAAMAALVHDRWLIRRLPALVQGAGFGAAPLRSHGFVQTTEADYMLTIVDRGADALVGQGVVSSEAAQALKAEARRRIEAGTFFGHIAYASLVSRKAKK